MKWGNSVAVRLPKAMLEAAKLEAGGQVELESQALGGILVRAKRRETHASRLALTPGIASLSSKLTGRQRLTRSAHRLS